MRRAISRRNSLMSTPITWAAPTARAIWMAIKPMGPHPRTTTRSPGAMWASSTPRMATPAGSNSDPSSYDTPDGSLNATLAGTLA